MSLSTLNSEYGLVSRIGGGSFGEIFLAKQKSTGRDVAAKVETCAYQETKSQLRREAKIYLKLSGQGEGFVESITVNFLCFLLYQ